MKLATKSLISALTMASQFMDEVRIDPGDDGWKIQVIDPSHVAMASILLKKDMFQDYEVWETFGINLKTILPKLKLCGEETDVVVDGGRITFKSDRLTQRSSLIDTSALFQMSKLPDPPLDVSCTIDAEYIRKGISAVPNGLDNLTFLAKDTTLTIYAMDESDSAECNLTTEEYIELMGEGKCSYPLDYVQGIFKSIENGTLVDIKFATDLPILIEFADETQSTKCLVAPRIESE